MPKLWTTDSRTVTIAPEHSGQYFNIFNQNPNTKPDSVQPPTVVRLTGDKAVDLWSMENPACARCATLSLHESHPPLSAKWIATQTVRQNEFASKSYVAAPWLNAAGAASSHPPLVRSEAQPKLSDKIKSCVNNAGQMLQRNHTPP